MRTKRIFVLAAGTTIVALIVFYIVLATSPPLESRGDAISLYGVVVDVAVGVFTVWGLYLAASEFAEARVRPDLDLVIGTPYANGRTRLPMDKEQLRGNDNIHSGYERPPVSELKVGLLLENTRPRAAQFIQISLHLEDVQKPIKFNVDFDSFSYYKPRVNTVDQESVSLQFGEDFVVYKGDDVYLGEICIQWNKSARPDRLVLKARLQNLIGDPKTVIISCPIKWGRA